MLVNGGAVPSVKRNSQFGLLGSDIPDVSFSSISLWNDSLSFDFTSGVEMSSKSTVESVEWNGIGELGSKGVESDT